VKPLGLRSRLTLLYSAIFTLLLAIVFFASYFLFKKQLEADMNHDVSDRMEALRGYIQFENNKPVLKFDTNDSKPDCSFAMRRVISRSPIWKLAKS
jgi:hypothetical protein